MLHILYHHWIIVFDNVRCSTVLYVLCRGLQILLVFQSNLKCLWLNTSSNWCLMFLYMGFMLDCWVLDTFIIDGKHLLFAFVISVFSKVNTRFICSMFSLLSKLHKNRRTFIISITLSTQFFLYQTRSQWTFILLRISLIFGLKQIWRISLM